MHADRGSLGGGQPRRPTSSLDPQSLLAPGLSESCHPKYCLAQTSDTACLATPSEGVKLVVHFQRGVPWPGEDLGGPSPKGSASTCSSLCSSPGSGCCGKLPRAGVARSHGGLQTASPPKVALLWDPPRDPDELLLGSTEGFGFSAIFHPVPLPQTPRPKQEPSTQEALGVW